PLSLGSMARFCGWVLTGRIRRGQCQCRAGKQREDGTRRGWSPGARGVRGRRSGARRREALTGHAARSRTDGHTNNEDTMRALNFELKQLCQRNRDGRFSTQYARERILSMTANQLHEMGFHHMQAVSLKPKHVEALVERWKAESLSAGTI